MIAWFAGQPLVFKIVLGGLGALLLLWLLWLLWLRKYLEWQNVKSLEIEKRVGLKIEFIKTAAQILGGAFFLVTIYVAWQNLVVSQEKYRTDLFVQAIKQLGDEKLEVRLGGIYALERIARDSEKDHGPIMEVLTAFVRLHAPWPPEKPTEAKEQPAESGKPVPGEKKPETKPAPEVKPRADIQAILTVIGRRTRTYGKGETQPLDLHETDLRGVDLREAHLEGADLHKAHLEGAILQEASREKVLLLVALFEKAFPNRAHQEGPSLAAAHLEGANLQEAHLEKAFLSGAHMNRASLNGAHLNGASLVAAHLEGANLQEAHLEGAILLEAYLEGAILLDADLRGTKKLTRRQIESATINENTKLPDYLKKAGPDKAKPQ